MARHRLCALGLLAAAACSGSPAGPGGGNGPTGRIFFQWRIPGDPGARPQVVVIPAAGGTPERVPIWFLNANNPTVDTAGSVVAFMAPANELATVSPDDSTIFHRVSQNINRSRPRISLDGHRVAMIFSPPLGANAEVRLIDLMSLTQQPAPKRRSFRPLTRMHPTSAGVAEDSRSSVEHFPEGSMRPITCRGIPLIGYGNSNDNLYCGQTTPGSGGKVAAIHIYPTSNPQLPLPYPCRLPIIHG